MKNDEEMLAYCTNSLSLWRWLRWCIVLFILCIGSMPFIPVVCGCTSGISWLTYIRSQSGTLLTVFALTLWLTGRWNGDPLHRYIWEKHSKEDAQPTSPGYVATRAAPEK